jgi:nitroreductase
MAVCPTQFIQVDGLSYDDNFTDVQPFGFGPKEFAAFLASRRSVRNFSGREVSKDLIQQVLDAVQYAPFGSHPEKVSMTVVNDRQTIESALPMISGFLDRIVTMIENPVISFIFRKTSPPEVYNSVKNHLYPILKMGTFKLENGDRITRGAPALILFHSDKAAEARTENSLINATYAMLQAHALGLGATMVEVVPAAINKVKELKALFQIPESHEVSLSLILGHPKYKYRRSISRPVHKVNWIGA